MVVNSEETTERLCIANVHPGTKNPPLRFNKMSKWVRVFRGFLMSSDRSSRGDVRAQTGILSDGLMCLNMLRVMGMSYNQLHCITFLTFWEKPASIWPYVSLGGAGKLKRSFFVSCLLWQLMINCLCKHPRSLTFGLGSSPLAKWSRGAVTSMSPRIDTRYWAMTSCCCWLQWFSNDRITG